MAVVIKVMRERRWHIEETYHLPIPPVPEPFQDWPLSPVVAVEVRPPEPPEDSAPPMQ